MGVEFDDEASAVELVKSLESRTFQIGRLAEQRLACTESLQLEGMSDLFGAKLLTQHGQTFVKRYLHPVHLRVEGERNHFTFHDSFHGES